MLSLSLLLLLLLGILLLFGGGVVILWNIGFRLYGLEMPFRAGKAFLIAVLGLSLVSGALALV